MRVIAGEAKGRRLKSAPSAKVRPSGDRLKEALFSTLGPAVEGAAVLDLYAGSGGLGIEALSRGAQHATFVESYPGAVAVIEQNLRSTGLTDRATLVGSTAEHFVANADRNPFDLVFVDPPYALGVPFQLLESLNERGLVNGGSRIVLEASSRLVDKQLPSAYHLESERRYGDSMLLYLTVEEGSS